MLWKRNVRSSVFKMVEDALQNPGAEYIAAGIPEYNVYQEAAFTDQDFAVVIPFIFLVDYGVSIALTRLPCVIVDIESHTSTVYELGNQARAKTHNVTLYVYGRDRGERDDIVSFLAEVLNSIDVYDFSSDVPNLVETVSFDDDVVVKDVYDPALAVEGTARHVSTLGFSFTTLSI